MRVCAITAAYLALSNALITPEPISGQEPGKVPASSAALPARKDGEDAISVAVSQLALHLQQHPAQPSKAADRLAGLYMIEVATGQVTLIADGPEAGTTFCGSAAWSPDGKRIYFDAMRPDEVQRAHLKAIELVLAKLAIKDLGVGNCPSPSPDGERIAFLLNYGGVPGAQGGHLADAG